VTYLDPQPDRHQFSVILAEHYIRDEARLERAFMKTREPVFSSVAAQICKRKKAGKILDVGCAGGHFLSNYFSPAGWERFGVEPSKFAGARAAEKGITVHEGELPTVDLPSTFFDVITILDTLSYFRDPRQELRRLLAALKPGGLLVIEQPLAATHVWRHATKLGRFLGGTPMSLLETGQNFLYDMPSLNFLLSKTGFAILESEPVPGVKQRQWYRNTLFKAYYLLSRLLWHLSSGREMFGPNFAVVASPAE